MRALSWWVTLPDLEIGNNGVFDEVRRRAESFAKANADTAIIFGAHFRWDFLPYWDILHCYMQEVSKVLNEYGIQLYDHHSCTLTHRYDDPADVRNLMFKYMRHLPFPPSREAAEAWSFNGEKLNSWRMIDARTNAPAYIKQYCADMFCTNNPGFRKAYAQYLKKLLSETGISGLMCDDIIYFGGFYQCSCPYCRAKLNFELPPASDTSFWGNWANPHWLEYLQMRRKSVGDYIAYIKTLLPENFPLMSCCTSGAYGGNNYNALSVPEFLRGDNRLNMEICGNEPGDVCEHLASNSYHAGVSKQYHVPVTAIGYGFFPGSAEHLWALNHLSGFSTWFSTLKGNLGLSKEQLEQLPDEASPIARAFAFEKKHPELFSGEQHSACAVYFPETTKTDSFFGACETGSTLDYRRFMSRLSKEGIAAETIFKFPENASSAPCVFLPSAAVMTAGEKSDMERYLASGGNVFSFGPDSLDGFPQKPDSDFAGLHWLQHQQFVYEGKDEWTLIRKGFSRNPSRTPSGIGELIEKYGIALPKISAEGFAVSMRGSSAHLLALDYEIKLHPLDKLRKQHNATDLIEQVTVRHAADTIQVGRRVDKVFCPLGGEARIRGDVIMLTGKPMYVILSFKE